MNAGSAITSRDSHEVRHIAAARHARSGRPRWKNEATEPDGAAQRRTREDRTDAPARAGERERAAPRPAPQREHREEEPLARADRAS